MNKHTKSFTITGYSRLSKTALVKNTRRYIRDQYKSPSVFTWSNLPICDVDLRTCKLRGKAKQGESCNNRISWLCALGPCRKVKITYDSVSVEEVPEERGL